MTILSLAILFVGNQDAKPMPLIQSTSLALSAGRLYAGTSSGEVHIYDALTREPITMIGSERKGIVSSIASSALGTAWIVGSRPTAIRDRFQSSTERFEQTLALRSPDGRTILIELKPAGVAHPVRDLAWLGSRLWLLSDFGAAFYNARTNAMEVGESFMPRAIASEVDRSHIWVRDPYVMTARPVSIRRNPKSTGQPYVSQFTIYKVEGNRWRRVGGLASNALDVEPERDLTVLADGKIPHDVPFQILSASADLDALGFMAIEGTNLLQAPIFTPNWESARSGLPEWFSTESSPGSLWVQVTHQSFWMWNGTALLSLGRTAPESFAFLPWNDPRMLPSAFLADDQGVWIATNVGVRRIQLDAPEKTMGFGGFIRVPLGPLTERAPAGQADKVLREIYRWRFAPEDLTGKDGGRFVSQVYHAVSIELPQTSAGILGSRLGNPVHDELKIGDVLSSARGLAVYVGNGKTAEVREGALQNGVVFDRSFAVVRRFLK